MTPEQILEDIRSKARSEDRLAYINRAFVGGQLTAEQWQYVAEQLNDDPASQLAALRAAGQYVEPSRAAEEATSINAQAAADAVQSNADKAFNDVVDAGGSLADADAAAVEAGGKTRFQEPAWIVRTLNRELTNDEKNRLLRHVRTYYGKNFTSFNQLLQSGYLDYETDQVSKDLAAVVTDQTLVQSLSMELPSGRTFTVSESQWAATQKAWAQGLDVVDIDSDFMVGIVKLADRAGIYGAYGEQPAWQPLGAWMKATGLMREWATFNSQDADLKDLQGRNQGRVPQHISDLEARGLMAGSGLLSDPTQQGVGYQFAPDYSNVPGNVQRETVYTGQSQVDYFKEQFQRGLELYGDDTTALVHALDPGLAYRVRNQVTTVDDARRVARLFMNAGYSSPEELITSMQDTGAAEFGAAGWAQFLGMDLEGDGSNANASAGGGAGAETRYPDPVGIDETLRTLYQQLFDAEPDQKTLAAFRAQVNGAVSSAAAQNLSSIDISARAMQFARNDPLYSELYGNRPGGMNELTYKQQFESGQSSMLGADKAGNVASRAGMRTGQYQTTIGAAAGTAEAWDNSTFLGRLARAAQVVGANT